MNIENLFDDLEKVKKELWHLIKKVIPRLEELIGGSSSQEIENIKTQLAEQLESIEAIESQLSSLNQTVSSHESTISSLSNSLSSINSQVGQISSDLESLESDVQSNTSSISSINSSLSEIESDIEANANAISGANSSIGTLQTSLDQLTTVVNQHSSSILTMGVDIADAVTTANEAQIAASGLDSQITTLSNAVTSNTSKVNALETDVGSLEDTTSTLQTSVSELSQSLTTLSQTVSSLEEQIAAASGETVETLYDMDSDDSTINHGWTSGMKGGNYLDTDYSQYRKVRIYARLYNANCVQEVSVKNRKYADITLNAASPTPTVLSFLKLQMSLEPYLNRLQVMAYARYAFSTSSGTFTLDFGLTSETFYVYRIEGIK